MVCGQCRNSEIYNHEQIKLEGCLKGVSIVKQSKSDSAIIGHLYQQLGDSDELWNSLDGIFACVLIDEATGQFCAARDPLGICPLYWGRGQDGSYWFASEMKALQDRCTWFEIFEPVSRSPCCLSVPRNRDRSSHVSTCQHLS